MLAAVLFLSAFAVIGAYLLFERLFYCPLCPDAITVLCEADENNTEMLIRSLRHYFPAAEIRITVEGETAAGDEAVSE